jgi:hypothetical protein
MTLAPTLSRLRLSPAELCVLLAAASLDPQPFIENSDLVTLTRPHLYQRLGAAREGLVLRHLVTVQEDDSLAVMPSIQELLKKAVQPRAGFQLFHSQSKTLPQRVLFSVSNDPIIMHRIRGDLEHTLEPIGGPGAIVEKVLQMSQPTASAERETQRAARYTVPNQVFAALAQTPPKPNAELLPLLTAAGLAIGEAEALLAAGLRPTQQTVFTALAIQGEQLGGGSAMWFADEKTAWLLSNFTQGGAVSLQPATAESIGQTVKTLVDQFIQNS